MQAVWSGEQPDGEVEREGGEGAEEQEEEVLQEDGLSGQESCGCRGWRWRGGVAGVGG